MSKMKEPEIAVAATTSSTARAPTDTQLRPGHETAPTYSKLKELEAQGYWFRVRFPCVARTWQSVDEMAADMEKYEHRIGWKWAERIEIFKRPSKSAAGADPA